MYYYILLIFKLFVFILSTKVSYSPWLVFSIDMVVVSALSFLFFRKEKWARVTSLIVYTLISIILTLDTAYFSYFNRLPVIRELGHAANVGDVTDALGLVLKPVLILYVFDLPFLFARVLRINKASISRFFRDSIKWIKSKWVNLIANIKLVFRGLNLDKRSSRLSYSFPMVSLAIFLIIVLIGAPFMTGSSHQSLFLYHTLDIAGDTDGRADEIEESEISDVIKNENHENDLTGVAEGRNLIVIQVESLNNFVINRKYGEQEITPNLNALVNGSGSIYASDFFETLGAGNTSDAEFVSMHSMYPSMKNPSYEVYLDKYLYGLPKIMKEHGYTPLALHGYRRDFWIRDRAYPHIGFEKFYAEDNYETDEMIGMGLGDKTFFRQSVPMLADEKEPFFAFLVTLTSHVPYEMPEETWGMNLEERDKGTLFGNYLQSVHYTDEAIGIFIEGLKEKGIYDNSIIAIYGDHHGFTGMDKAVNDRIAEFTGIDFDFDTLLNIPLIINVPGGDFNRKIEGVRSQLDFAPTVLNLLGIDYAKYIFMGQDILDENHYATLYPQSYMLKGSFINDDYIFTMTRDGIFENGKLKNRHTRQIEDNTLARSIHEEGIKRINMSKSILEHDLIKPLMSGESLDNVKSEELKLADAVEVKDSYEVLKAYEAGFDTFRVRFNMTEDGYFISSDAKGRTLNEISGNYITLGDLVTRYSGLNFIVSTPNAVGLAEEIRKIPGLHDNITVEVKNIPDYEKVSNKQNGYKIMFSASHLEPNKLISMSELNSDLIFYGNSYPELERKTYFAYNKEFTHVNTIYLFSEADLTKKRDFDIDYNIKTLDLIPHEGEYSLDELMAHEDPRPLLIKFEYDENSGETWVSGIQKGEERFTLQDLDELLKANKNLSVAISSDINLYDIYRTVAGAHLDQDRIVPVTTQAWALMHPARLGFKDYVYLNEDSPETYEIIKLNKAARGNIVIEE